MSQDSDITNTIVFSTENDLLPAWNATLKSTLTRARKKIWLIKELSDTAQELNSNKSNDFFNISVINLVADTIGYIKRNERFDLVPNKQKIIVYDFDCFDPDENKSKKTSTYTPEEHFQSSVFTFKNPTTKWNEKN